MGRYTENSKYRTDILKTDYLYQYRRRYLEYRKKIANTDN